MSCPNCKEAGTKKYRPFCSKRCADVDLARWMSGSYAVPSMREENEEEAIEAIERAFFEAQENEVKKPH
jgi:endogenous inhibitor of DNA gyrase (YacG/DUF329 family)